MVDRSPLEDPVGLREGQARLPRQPLADVLVPFELVFSAPAVEAEALAPAALAAAEYDRPGVAQPDIAERLDDHLSEWAQLTRAFGRPLMRRDQPYLFAFAAGVN